MVNKILVGLISCFLSSASVWADADHGYACFFQGHNSAGPVTRESELVVNNIDQCILQAEAIIGFSHFGTKIETVTYRFFRDDSPKGKLWITGTLKLAEQ